MKHNDIARENVAKGYARQVRDDVLKMLALFGETHDAALLAVYPQEQQIALREMFKVNPETVIRLCELLRKRFPTDIPTLLDTPPVDILNPSRNSVRFTTRAGEYKRDWQIREGYWSINYTLWHVDLNLYCREKKTSMQEVHSEDLESAEVPRLEKGRWSCPPGYAYPRCLGCGHNFFEGVPRRVNAQGHAPDGGLCQWCIAEMPEE